MVAAASLTLVLSGCGGSGGSDSKSADAQTPAAADSLKIWTDQNREAGVRAAIDKFTADTGTEVTVEVKNFDDIRTDFLTQVPTGEGHDITVGAHDWLGEFVSNGVVAPVELGDKAKDFNPVAVNAFTWQGRTYGLPYGVESVALLRTRDFVPDAPATYDDRIAAGKAAGTQFPFVIQVSDKGDAFHMYPFQTSFDAPVFKQADDGSYLPELAMGGDGGHRFAQWLHDQGAAKNLDVALSSDIAKQQFLDGNAPFIVSGHWLVQDAKDKNINLGVSEVPSAGGSPAQPFASVQGFYVSAKSPNAIVANDFLLNYMGTKEMQTMLFEKGNRTPALTAAADAISGDPVAEGFAKVAQNAQPMPAIPEMSQVWQLWGVTEAEIIKGEDPNAAWDKMISDINNAIA